MTSNKAGITALYLQGFIQGIGFTTIPASGNFLMNSMGLSSSQYGSLFLPMIIGAILASYIAGEVAKKLGLKLIFGCAGFCNIISMLLYSYSQTIGFLYLAMLFLGLGFGSNLTTLNSYVLKFFPKKSSAALTALHACLGIGTAIGPLSFAFFEKNSQWWFDPLVIAASYGVLWIAGLMLFPSHFLHTKAKSPAKYLKKWPIYFTFASIALLYGICETTFGNWGPLFLHKQQNFSLAASDEALSLFWAALTCGRIIAVLFCIKIAPKWVYRCLAPLILIALIILLMTHTQLMATLAFVIAGLGCSAYLPLTINLAQKNYISIAEAISGEMMAIYMIGYGIAAQGVGLINRFTTISWHSLFLLLFFIVLIMGIGTFVVERNSLKNNI